MPNGSVIILSHLQYRSPDLPHAERSDIYINEVAA